MAEGVIYKHTIEAFIQHVVLRRGLLSIEFDRELRGLGLDVSRPREVSLATWEALLKATAKRAYPKLAEDDALEEVGREVMRGFAAGFVGKGLLMVLRMLGPRRALLRMMENFRTADSVTTMKAVELSPTCIELDTRPVTDVPTYVCGLLSEIMVLLAAREPKVEHRIEGKESRVFKVTWVAGK